MRTLCWLASNNSCKPPARYSISCCWCSFWADSATSSTSSTILLRKRFRKPASRLNPKYGIPPHETFAVKSMEVNFNLLKLKLDMVYRDLPIEEAQKRFGEATTIPEGVAEAAAPVEDKKKPKRKVVKALVPKNM